MSAECPLPRVAVLRGGVSSERSISLQSGQAVIEALRAGGFDVRDVVLDAEVLPGLEVDAVFIALHGRFGEDGAIQRLLNARGVPYTGSGAEASALAFDKRRARDALLAAGLPAPPGVLVDREAPMPSPPFPLPWVVKPPREGSSFGISIVTDAGGWDAARQVAGRCSEDLLVERFIPGREWTVGWVDDTLLPPVEILPPVGKDWYDWDAKYASQGATRYDFPDSEGSDRALCRKCRDLTRAAVEALGARGFGRVDFRITPEGEPYILELNSIPGLTGQSLLPKAAGRAGIGFASLCARILRTARTD